MEILLLDLHYTMSKTGQVSEEDNGRINPDPWDQTISGADMSDHLIDYLDEEGALSSINTNRSFSCRVICKMRVMAFRYLASGEQANSLDQKI